jgi:hypothetical protein
VADEVVCCHSDVLGDLAQQRRSYIAALVEGNGCEAPIGVFELLVGAALPDQFEPKLLEDIGNFRGLENWSGSHD